MPYTIHHEKKNILKNTAASTTFVGLGGISLSSFSSVEEKKSLYYIQMTFTAILILFLQIILEIQTWGAARRASIIEQIRKEEKNVLLLDAGDIFQGTPYFNYYGVNWSLKS